jgi:Spy/CpxP family protein refolding chaperone
MKKISLGAWVIVLVLALGLTVADAQMSSPMGGMGGGMAGGCGGMAGKAMMGKGMMGGSMMGGCGCGMMNKDGRMAGGCGCGMMDKGNMGRHMGMMGEMGMKGMHHRIWRHIMALDLDQKQKAEIRTIKTDLMKDMIRKKADLRIAMLELGELVQADKVDMKDVEAKVKQIEGLKASMLLAGIQATETVKSKLTDEQKKKLDEMTEGPMRCNMMGDNMMRGSMTDEGMMEEGTMGEAPASPSEGEVEEAPAGHN